TVDTLLYDTFVNLHTLPVHPVSDIDFYSAVDYAPIALNTESVAHNIGKTIGNRVDFPRIVNKVYAEGARIFVDLGPRGSAATWIKQILENQTHVVATVDRKGKDNYAPYVKALATLLSHQVAVDLSPLYDTEPMKNLKQKALIKTVQLGGQRIDDTILSTPNTFLKQEDPHSSTTELVIAAPYKNGHPPTPETVPTLTPQQHLPQSTLPDQAVMHNRSALSESHAAFLSLRTEALQQQGEMIQLQASLMEQTMAVIPSAPFVAEPSHSVVWNETDLLAFAKGSIADVFGQEYAIIDTYHRRVRLPMPPYLLVSRVTHLKGERGVFKASAMTTEYDIPENAWYTVDGQIPWAVAVESGQCDLLLISYLGIDFESKGERIYRLLDCTLTFLEDLPQESETLRYDIKINSFSRNGDSLLFFFSYECFVKDKMVLKMDGGCAGFFTNQELDQGKGVIFTEAELATKRAIKKQTFEAPLACDKTMFDRQDLLYLTQGDLTSCFGEAYQQHKQNPSLLLPPQDMLMIDRVTSVDAQGGAWGLGLIVAEKDLRPDDWYFPCHFKDDQVLAGSLMGEACSQLMQFFQLYLGLHTYTQDARFQPIADLPQRVRCRGQVIPSDTLLTYKMEIKEVGLNPTPYAIADVEAILDGKTIVHFQDLGMQLSEKSDIAPYRIHLQEAKIKVPLFNEAHITEFATGSISACFGPDYNMYESKRCPRTPNGDLQLISR
ncbi:MAG: 3-hydroxyacyl-[acyl-carrier-protein] dehydratase FabA, partial [Candidatus Latescibacteria bacterium]|nr:3-hydroxyacyl-[acyl-carrier-protein] dehydratase FabA [Candidatus Latescibacterota bacterium]